MPKQDNPLATLIMGVRQALLMMVDAIEVYFNIPRTSAMRKKAKSEVVEQRTGDEVL